MCSNLPPPPLPPFPCTSPTLNLSALNVKRSCPLHSVDGRNPELRGGQAGRCLVAPGSRPLSLSLLAICHPHPLLPTHSLSLFSHTLSLKPSSLNPQPQTPKPRPLTPNLKPQTLKSQPETLNNKQQTSNNQKVTINDKIPHETIETLKPCTPKPQILTQTLEPHTLIYLLLRAGARPGGGVPAGRDARQGSQRRRTHHPGAPTFYPHIQGISSPFYSHIQSISSPFYPHFQGISGPFYTHISGLSGPFHPRNSSSKCRNLPSLQG